MPSFFRDGFRAATCGAIFLLLQTNAAFASLVFFAAPLCGRGEEAAPHEGKIVEFLETIKEKMDVEQKNNLIYY